MSKRLLGIFMLVLLLSFNSQYVLGVERSDIPVFVEPRYLVDYPPRFFELGGSKVKYDPDIHLKIGIVIRNKTEMTIPFIINVIFGAAPFDRYREFFVFSNSDEVLREVRLNNQFITTYDSYGRRIGGGFDWKTMRVRAGLVVLNVSDYEFRSTGTLGYAFNKTAVTQKVTILHELGHVLGDLGDEYSIGERENQGEEEALVKQLGKEYEFRLGKSWNRVRANLEYRTRNPIKWFPLIERGFVQEFPPNRVELKEGHDVGIFVIPEDKCIMNHPEKVGGDFVPFANCNLLIKYVSTQGHPILGRIIFKNEEKTTR